MVTREDILAAFRYYTDHGGYCEKASAKNLSREISDFAANKGSANYTYMGKLCGCNPGAWCAMMVSTAVYEACGGDRTAAKKAMWGRWPHYNCGTIFDDPAAMGLAHYSPYGLSKKGKSGAPYTPRPGDVIVFTNNWSTRDHTGMVYAVDDTTVYTYEGNSGNMARKRSYPLASACIYGYCRLDLEADAAEDDPIRRFQRWLGVTADGIFGPVTKSAAVKAHQRALNEGYGTDLARDGIFGPDTYYATEALRPGDEGEDVTVWQGLLYAGGCDPVGMDGAYGPNTAAATAALQEAMGLTPTGLADRYTWARALGLSRPEHTTLRRGSTGPEVKYLQRTLTMAGHTLATDGIFGPATEEAVRACQEERGLTVDGIVGPETWGSLD